ASTMLVKYYANSPLYLYQWTKTPNDNTSWKNVGNPQTLATFNFTNPTAHAAFSGLNSGDKLYFRVIAGTSSVFTSFNNFTAPHYANSNDPCKNYSISDPIQLTYNCPTCKKPDSFTINSSNGLGLCPGESTVLSPSKSQSSSSDFDFTWYKGSHTTDTIVDGPKSNISTLSYTVNAANVGEYTLLVRDKLMPDQQSCWAYASTTITSAVLPEYTITGGGTFCEGDNITPVTVNFTKGVQPYSITYTGPGGTTINNITTSSQNLGTAKGTYKLTAISDKNCTGVATSAERAITINPIPEATISSNKLSYCGTVSDVNLSVTPKSGVDLTGATYQWKRNGSNVSTSSTINGATAGTYTVVITLNTCTYTTPPVTVTSYPLPTYTITGGDTYCANEDIKDIVITFTGTPNFTFDEAVTGAGKTSTSNVYTITNPGEGVYQPTNIKDGNGCLALASSASTEVVIHPIPPLPTVTSPIRYCQNTTGVPALNAVGTALKWYTAAEGGSS